ncbi:hypothetical protein BDP81DRAFT_31254 [Colletotrichum phormii]|uniref:Uncharacterized protein n=1 Tax=Colletotrichum phormii TaxID=359342 RepID=A0AAI9ZSB1_9PEZI|nr:uncharacterized protein BDP81DRAFT_31254 [Colletotrichum phormii]KAK1635924.1 hypothetical protein BDP81DRAFT_31254 [Colletotrichum phormii]
MPDCDLTPKKDELIRLPGSRKQRRETQCVSWAAECDHKGLPRSVHRYRWLHDRHGRCRHLFFFGSSIRFLWPRNLVTKEGLDRCCSSPEMMWGVHVRYQREHKGGKPRVFLDFSSSAESLREEDFARDMLSSSHKRLPSQTSGSIAANKTARRERLSRIC